MAVTQNSYTQSGSTTEYAFTFPYLKTTDIKVQLDAAVTTAFSLLNATTIKLDSAPAAGTAIKIYRETDTDSAPATFYAGSSVKSEDLNDNFTQNLYANQEINARYISNLAPVLSGDVNLEKDVRIIFEGATDDGFETTLTVTDPTADRTITLPNVTGTVVTTGDTGTVTSTMIADATIATADLANNAVTTAKITDANITTAKIATSAVTTAKIADNEVTADKLAHTAVTAGSYTATDLTVDAQGRITAASSGTISTSEIANNAITAAKIADDTITASQIANDAVTGNELADNAVDTAAVAASAITANELASNAVTTAKINADAVDGTKIADNSINSEHYVDGSIDHEHLATGIVQSENIAANNITNALMADNAIDSAEIVAGAIDTAHIADSQVTTAKIADVNVTTAKIANDAVTNAKIADDQIDSEHYVDGSIDTAHIADLQVTTAKIAADAITNAKIADDQIDSEHYVDGSIDAAHLASNAVTTVKITDANITTAKIADDAVTTAKIADAELVTLAGMQTGTASKLAAGTTLTSDIADLNQIDGMTKETSVTDDDAKFPTSGAVVDYVAAQIAPLGGLEVIATDAAFPNTQPSSGVVISIADAGGLVVNGSGTSTTGRTANGTTVTINNINSQFNSTTIDAGVAMMVSSTGSGQIYNYHKATLKEADLLSLSGDINDFAERYRVSGTAPSSSLDEGDLWWDTATDKLKVYDGSAWGEVASSGDFYINTISSYSGTGGNSATFDGTAYRFVLSNPGSSAQQHVVSINGVIQKPNSGTSQPSEGFVIDGSSIIFSNAPASGSDYFILTIGNAVSIGTPSDNTVATAKLQNLAVTTAKIAADAVDGTKIADNAIDSEHYTDGSIDLAHMSANSVDSDQYVDGSIDTAHIADLQVTTAKIAADAITGAKIADDAIGAEHLAADIDIATTGGIDINSDTAKLKIGAGDDLQLYHDGSNSYILNGGGDLRIWAKPNEYAMVCVPDAQVELYHNNVMKFNTSSTGVEIVDEMVVNGTGDTAIRLANGGTNKWSFFNNSTGSAHQLQIYDNNGSAAAAIFNTNASVELYYNSSKKFETTSSGIKTVGNVVAMPGDVSCVSDSNKITAGLGDDLQLYHDGSHTYIDNHVGNLYIRNGGGDTILIQPLDGEDAIKAYGNDRVELAYDNVKKFETNSTGTKTTGGHIMTNGGTLTGGDLSFADNSKAKLGDGDDLQIYHNGSHNYIVGATGQNTYIGATNGEIQIQPVFGTDHGIRVINNGAVELYHDGTKTFETTSTGIKVTGTLEQTKWCMDEWRTNDSIRGTHSTIGSGGSLWERCDTTGMANKLIDDSTGMTESNGIFTFPSTGKWHVDVWWRVYSASGQSETIMGIWTYFTTDNGSNWTEMVGVAESAAQGSAHAVISSACTVDVTDTSNCKIRLATSAGQSNTSSGSYFFGNSSTNDNLTRFTRIGDT